MWGGGKMAVVSLSPHTAKMRKLFGQASTTMAYDGLKREAERRTRSDHNITMVAKDDELYLYHLTLKKQTNFVHSCIGHFVDLEAGSKREQSQLCVATETHLELYDTADGELKLIAKFQNLFATITSMKSLDLPHSGSRAKASNWPTFLALTSDSGNLSIMQIIMHAGALRLKTLVNQPLTRTTLRRVSPISYMEIDPNGRCIILSSVEQNKLCFLVDYAQKLRISSPLEIIRPHMVTLDMAVVDVNFNNPCFVTLEIDNAATQLSVHLIFYVLELGLNHIVKKADYLVNPSANFVLSLPDLSRYNITTSLSDNNYDADYDTLFNPFVVIGFENHILVKDMNGFFSLKVEIPKRSITNSRHKNVTIISGIVQKLKNDFFVLLQSNHGDLFKLTVSPDTNDRNRPLVQLSYFDTIQNSHQLHIFKNGYLFALSEMNNNFLFQFEKLGVEKNDFSNVLTSKDPNKSLVFEPSIKLQNLSILSQQLNLNPSIKSQIVSDSPLSIATKHFTNNKIITLTNAVNYSNLISTSLPPNATKLWLIPDPATTGDNNTLLFITFPKKTMILQIDNESMEELTPDEATRSAFKLSQDTTIHTCLMGSHSIIQVCTAELRHIVPTGKSRYSNKLTWVPPAGIRIVCATSSKTQLIISLSNYELVYFKIDVSSDSLIELTTHPELDTMPSKVAIVQDTQHADLLAIADNEGMIKIMSLKDQKEDFLTVISLQLVSEKISDMIMVRDSSIGQLNLHVGLENGVYMKFHIGDVDGSFTDIKRRFLGLKPVSLSYLREISVSLNNEEEEEEEEDDDDEKEEEEINSSGAKWMSCVVCHSSSTWVSYTWKNVWTIRQLKDQNMLSCSKFVNADVAINGVCSISSSGRLNIGRVSNFPTLDNWFHVHESSVNKQENGGGDESNEEEEDEMEEEMEMLQISTFRPRTILSFPNNPKSILFIDNHSGKKQCRISLQIDGECLKFGSSDHLYKILDDIDCVSAAIIDFTRQADHLIICAGDKRLLTYKILVNKDKLSFDIELLHQTEIISPIHAMLKFKNFLLTAMGSTIVLYGLGKKQLLRRSVTQTPVSITKIVSMHQWNYERLAVGDIHESVTLFIWDPAGNVFIPYVDDSVKRHVTVLKFLDEATVIGADRYGNAWTLRSPPECEKIMSNHDPSELSNGAIKYPLDVITLQQKLPNTYDCKFKFQLLNHFFVNDIITDFHILDSLSNSDRPGCIYMGLQGTVGCFIPLLSKGNVFMMGNIENIMAEADDTFYLDYESRKKNNNMRKEDDEEESGSVVLQGRHGIEDEIICEGSCSILGRDHQEYRSYYAPVRKVIDGDLCENFLRLSLNEQEFLAKNLKSVQVEDIIQTINEVRTNYM
ncbi:BPK_HP2_G0038150.mRNA.1.CDS.1 [Saccharomyces cerevisiae]|nr:Rse1p [Saccharomyces cerevisiae YJM1078]AJS83658.1 Rse1p [Saccharomyces cerevisiae YJM1332]EWH16592.1 Rse1p [Saccharomyces cerevisiae P283]CAI5298147.1 BPK_HP2_G0038150.mRNA.1.CDS.1 [Saccharomyces cerevisiae]CAI6631530.1 BPK_HP2_G0038150.mRNA.1.CDS.1 [Saccharomyces cerevisiae]